jgi:FMN phosphatase YigB (HAD superfamily)
VIVLIKNIIFDLGNVLLNFQPIEYLSNKISDKEKVAEIYEIIFRSKEWLDLDRGVISESEAIEVFCRRNPENDHLIRTCMDNWCDMFTPIEGSVEILKQLKAKGYKTYILSNFHELAFEYVAKEHDFFKHFDGGIISYREKLLKPEGEIYMKLSEIHGLNPQESLFIDDTEVNVAGARESGFHAIHFKNPEQLLEAMKGYNIL